MFGMDFLHQIRISFIGENKVSSAVDDAIGDMKKLSDVGDKMKSAGKTSMAIGAGIGAAAALPIKAAVDLETGMVGVKKTTGLAFDEIKSGISDLVDKNIPTSIEGLNQIAETAGQLGIRGKQDIFGFTEAIAKIEAVSDLTADQAASSFAGFANVFKVPIAQAENMGSTINELSNTTNATAGFITDAMARIGRPIESLTFQQVAGLSASLGDIGLGAERGGTALRNAFGRMQTRVAQGAAFMKMSTSDWAQAVQKDGVGAFIAVMEKVKGLDASARVPALTKMFGEEVALQAVRFADNIDVLKKNLGVANTSFAENISLNNELQNVMDSSGGKLTVMWNKIKLMAASLGGPMLDSLKWVIDGISWLATKFRVFADAHPMITRVVLSLMMLSSVLLMVGGAGLWMAGSIATSVASVMQLADKSPFVAKMLGKFKLAIIGVGKALTFLFANPIGIVILAVAALGIGLYMLYKRSETFRNVVHAIGSAIGEFFEPMIKRAAVTIGHFIAAVIITWRKIKGETSTTWPVIKTALQNVMLFIQAYFIPVLGILRVAWQNMWGVMSVVLRATWDTFKAIVVFAFSSIWIAIKTSFQLIWGIFKVFMQLLSGDWAGAWETMKETFTNVWDGILAQFKNFGSFAEKLRDIFLNAGVGLITAFADGLKNGWGALKGGVINLFNKILPYLTGSDAEIGPLSNITGSGQGFVEAYASGMQSRGKQIESTAEDVLGLAAPDGSGSRTVGTSTTLRGATIGSLLHVESIVIQAENVDEGLDSLKEKLIRIVKEMNDELGGYSVEPA